MPIEESDGQDGPEGSDEAASSAAPGEGEPSDTDVEREIHPDEWAATIVACMGSQGFVTAMTPDGGVDMGDVPEEQSAQAAEVMDECIERFPVEEAYRAPLDDGQIRSLYRWHVEQSVPCLEGQGITVHDIPSEEVFVQRYGTDAHWSPFIGVHMRTELEWHELVEACPQNPPVELLRESE